PLNQLPDKRALNGPVPDGVQNKLIFASGPGEILLRQQSVAAIGPVAQIPHVPAFPVVGEEKRTDDDKRSHAADDQNPPESRGNAAAGRRRERRGGRGWEKFP